MPVLPFRRRHKNLHPYGTSPACSIPAAMSVFVTTSVFAWMGIQSSSCRGTHGSCDASACRFLIFFTYPSLSWRISGLLDVVPLPGHCTSTADRSRRSLAMGTIEDEQKALQSCVERALQSSLPADEAASQVFETSRWTDIQPDFKLYSTISCVLKRKLLDFLESRISKSASIFNSSPADHGEKGARTLLILLKVSP